MTFAIPTFKESLKIINEEDEVLLLNDDFEEGAVNSYGITALEEPNDISPHDRSSLWHWADVDVVAESDEEINQSTFLPITKRCNKKETNLWYQCELCVYGSLSKEVLLNHMLRKHTVLNLPHQHLQLCLFCGYEETSGNEELIIQHLQEEHLPGGRVINSSNQNVPSQEKEFIVKKRTKLRRKKHHLPAEQVALLERVFQQHQYINRQMRNNLAQQLGITMKQVQMWFANRRYKLRNTC